MFTDLPATPTQLEVLVELVWEMRQRKLDRDTIRKLLQPKGLPDLTEKSQQSINTLKAALELCLVTKDAEGSFRPGWNSRRPFSARDLIVSALDEKVLSSTDVELWFARFFSYIITKDDDALPPGIAGERWANDFNRDLYSGTRPDNPFNRDKYTALRRWLRYTGLGWHDAQDNFIPSPYDRVLRNLDGIFGKRQRLSSDEFMASLASRCPELDGGFIFRESNRNFDLNRTCTRALSTVLRDLHDDKIIKLDCPSDSRGWSLVRAGVILNPQEGLLSDKFDFIEHIRNP